MEEIFDKIYRENYKDIHEEMYSNPDILTRKLNEISQQYQFNLDKEYVVPLSHMLVSGLYKRTLFREYLDKIKDITITNFDKIIITQACYLAGCYIGKNPQEKHNKFYYIQFYKNEITRMYDDMRKTFTKHSKLLNEKLSEGTPVDKQQIQEEFIKDLLEEDK